MTAEAGGNRERVRSLQEQLQAGAEPGPILGELREILEHECHELAKAEVG